MPRVSVVVPAFRNAPFLPATLESVLGQSFGDFELIVSDHSSDDGSEEIAREYARQDSRVRVTTLPAGGGAPANWQAVSALASADLLKLVCGDDLIQVDCLQVQVRAFELFPQAVLVAAKRDVVDAAGRPLIRGRGLQGLRGPLVDGRDAIRRTVLEGTNIFGEPGTVLMRRAVFEQVGGWDSRFPYLIDMATYAAVLAHGPMVAVPRSLAGFRLSDAQWSVALVDEQYRHARDFHHAMAQEHPGLLSRADLLRGDGRAWLNARLRRATSSLLRRRARRS